MTRNILAVTIGSEGDMRPFAALGREMVDRGYGFTVAAPSGHREFVEDQGVTFCDLGKGFGDALKRVSKPSAGSGKLARMHHTLAQFAAVRDAYRGAFRRAQEIANQADVILFHPLASFARYLADANAVPAYLTAFQPVIPSVQVPLPFVSSVSGGNVLNRLSHQSFRLVELLLARDIKAFLKCHPGVHRAGPLAHPAYRNGKLGPALMAFSPTIAPRPLDWPSQIQVTGAWHMELPSNWVPPHNLQRFLDAGAPPIYVGFGSWSYQHRRNTDRVVTAIEKWGGRAVIARGRGGLRPTNLPENIHLIRDVPHAWLFPRMAAVVHHGGAGTTAAGLQAGRPTLITAIHRENSFWGKHVARLGAGPPPLVLSRLTSAALAAGFADTTSNAAYAKAAQSVAARMTAEDGIGTAIETIERSLSARPADPPIPSQ